MRPLLTLALMLSLTHVAGAADEVFTLADGRTFVGQYDAEAGQLHTRIGAREATIAVAKEQIVGRSPFDPAKAPKVTPAATSRTVVEKPNADPAAMSSEEKARTEKAYGRAAKLREADEIDGAANKLERDAKTSMDEAAHSRDQARRNAAKFEERAREEQLIVGEPDVFNRLIALKRTNANNQATIDAWRKADAAEAKAQECSAEASARHAQAASARAAAGTMPVEEGPVASRGPLVAPVATAPAAGRQSPTTAMPQGPTRQPAASVVDAWHDVATKVRALRAAEMAEESRLMAEWAIDIHHIPQPALSADPRQSELATNRDIDSANQFADTVDRCRAAGDWRGLSAMMGELEDLSRTPGTYPQLYDKLMGNPCKNGGRP